MLATRLMERRRVNPKKLACLAGAGLLAAVSAITSAQDPLQSHAQTRARTPGGDKSDIDAIANRACHPGAYTNHFTLERQVSVGRSVARQIDSQVRFVNDPVVVEYVNRIGQNLARHSNAEVAFTIKVIDSGAVNALSLPGGSLYVTSGLILAADEEAELAGVMAHEIAHIAVCHAGRLWSSTERVDGVPSLPITVTPDGGSTTGLFGIARFTRGLEAEADYLGIQYLYRAGYDPSALVSYFEKIDAMEKPPWRPEAVASGFQTHPQNPDRIERSQKEIGSMLPSRSAYLVTNTEFDGVKARLATIESRPTLKRLDDSN